MVEPSPIILVHGAWCDHRTWDNVARLLRKAGREVIALDLPGHGADQTPPESVGLSDYASQVAGALKEFGPSLLVGHSMGGMAISAAAELVPHLVTKLAYVAAFLPQHDQSLLDLMMQGSTRGLRDMIQRSADQPGVTWLDGNTATDVLCQDANAREKTLALSGLGVQPNKPQTDRVQLSAENFASRPRAYVFCEQDRTVTPDLQRMMVDASPCSETYSLSCGHLPQLTRPSELAHILSNL